MVTRSKGTKAQAPRSVEVEKKEARAERIETASDEEIEDRLPERSTEPQNASGPKTRSSTRLKRKAPDSGTEATKQKPSKRPRRIAKKPMRSSNDPPSSTRPTTEVNTPRVEILSNGPHAKKNRQNKITAKAPSNDTNGHHDAEVHARDVSEVEKRNDTQPSSTTDHVAEVREVDSFIDELCSIRSHPYLVQLTDMLRLAKLVGTTSTRDGQIMARAASVKTKHEEIEEVYELQTKYTELFNAHESGDDDTSLIKDDIAKLTDHIMHSLHDLLAKQWSDKKLRRLLREFYFNFVPALLRLLAVACTALFEEDNVDSPNLQPFEKLISLVCDLFATAKRLNAGLDHTSRGKFSKPIVQIIPRLILLLGTTRRDASRRDQARAATQREARYLELRHNMEAEELEAEADRKRLIKENHARQARSFRENLKRLPPSVQRQLLGQEHQTPNLSQGGASAEGSRPQTRDDGEDDEEDDPSASQPEDEDDEEIERVEGIFPKSNTYRPLPDLTDEQVNEFLELMRIHSGNERKFEIAADEMDMPIEQVFARAREYQRHFDDERAKGRFCDDEDEWLVSIWDFKHG